MTEEKMANTKKQRKSIGNYSPVIPVKAGIQVRTRATRWRWV